LKVNVSWDKSTSADVIAYEIERKLTSEDDIAFSVVGSTGSAASSYIDTVPTDESVDYRVRAKDSEALYSGYSNSTTVVPYKMAIPVPIGVTAAPKVDQNAAIEVKWSAPAGVTVKNYSVYRRPQGPGEAFVKVYTTN